jgi:hypothetical protein
MNKNTLSDRLGVSDGGHDTNTKKPYSLKEVTCSSCDMVLMAIILATGDCADLVWPHRVVHLDNNDHTLVLRRKGEDANCTVRGRGITLEEAAEYFAGVRS